MNLKDSANIGKALMTEWNLTASELQMSERSIYVCSRLTDYILSLLPVSYQKGDASFRRPLIGFIRSLYAVGKSDKQSPFTVEELQTIKIALANKNDKASKDLIFKMENGVEFLTTG